MGMMQEFKDFIAKGNVVDFAVAVIMATYFGLIVKSLIDNIIMPLVGMALGGQDLSTMKHVLKEGTLDEAGKMVGEVAIGYGALINSIMVFVIVAFVVFLLVKAYNNMKKPEVEEEAGPTEVEMLTEIRDLLKK